MSDVSVPKATRCLIWFMSSSPSKTSIDVSSSVVPKAQTVSASALQAETFTEPDGHTSHVSHSVSDVDVQATLTYSLAPQAEQTEHDVSDVSVQSALMYWPAGQLELQSRQRVFRVD